MCGICGAVRLQAPGPISEAAIVAMRDTMPHRGPDDEGVYLAPGVGLGHRRLSIIDLSGGRQPMSNADESLCVTFVGEIYNFRELRGVLEARGYVFRTKSDTEVILHAYAEFGERCVEHLRGMFAFGLWDARRRQLFVARDRVGIKPLYYTIVDGTLLFASEIKALLGWPGVRREVDETALGAYLRYRYVPGPRTMFRGISKLQPGRTLSVKDGVVTERQYWDVPLGEEASEAGSKDRLLELFQESVRLRLISDVPLGVFLSGGLDSSAVTAMMASVTDQPIQTFSVGYPDGAAGSEVTEFEFARLVATRFKTDHHEVALDASTFWAALPKLIWHFDEPVADSAAIPLYFLSRFARQFVTVALSGEGADEVMGGYAMYRKMLLLERLRRLPFASRIAGVIEPHAGRRTQRYLRRLTRPLRSQYRGVSALFAEEEAVSLLRPELRGRARWDDQEDAYFDRVAGLDPLSQMLYFDLKVWLPDDLLVKADKMTMATSVELRVPFLDHRLVEWLWRVPASSKLRGRTGKWLLRDAMRDLLPAPILERKKLGFPVPIHGWFQGGLAKAARELLLDPCGASARFFEPARIAALLARHERGGEDLSGEIYALLVFAIWHRIFIEPSVVSTSAPTEMRLA
jgi:asparagine synthase (glutamine-hydrolysing)